MPAVSRTVSVKRPLAGASSAAAVAGSKKSAPSSSRRFIVVPPLQSRMHHSSGVTGAGMLGQGEQDVDVGHLREVHSPEKSLAIAAVKDQAPFRHLGGLEQLPRQRVPTVVHALPADTDIPETDACPALKRFDGRTQHEL